MITEMNRVSETLPDDFPVELELRENSEQSARLAPHLLFDSVDLTV